MIDAISPSLAATNAATTKPKNDPARVADAAGQFEALLMGQILKSIREAEGKSWLGTGEDNSGESAMALAEEHLAGALSKTGGLGLAKTIVRDLSHTT